MELMANQAFRLLNDGSDSAYPSGLYRVIFDEPKIGKTICVCIELLESEKVSRGGRKRITKTKQTRRKAPSGLIGELVWMERDELQRLYDAKFLIHLEIEREGIYFPTVGPRKHEHIFKRRCLAMSGFLNFENLRDSILAHTGIGGLVREAVSRENVCRTFVYKQWSTLCRLGISDLAPGIRIP